MFSIFSYLAVVIDKKRTRGHALIILFFFELNTGKMTTRFQLLQSVPECNLKLKIFDEKIWIKVGIPGWVFNFCSAW